MEEIETEDSQYLNFEETRVLGALAEKAIVTPENYPLSVNSLTNACNQKTSRHPKTELTEEEIEQALDSLRVKKLVMLVHLAGSRISRYQHRMEDKLHLSEEEIPLLIVLMLRGPQTIGELRSRTERMHTFEDLEEVERNLEALRGREVPLVEMLAPAPGQKETRFYHLLTDAPEVEETAGVVYVPAPDRKVNQVEEMEREMNELREEVDALRGELREISDAFREFKKEFE